MHNWCRIVYLAEGLQNRAQHLSYTQYAHKPMLLPACRQVRVKAQSRMMETMSWPSILQ